MWDEACDYNAVRELRVKTTAYLGVGAIDKLDDILAQFRQEGINALLCVTGGHAYKVTGRLGQAGGSGFPSGYGLGPVQ